jgi:putative peptide zinc metalloprotease protein
MATLPAVTTAPERPRLADGLELIGEYRDSGFREAPYLVRHPDGRFAQLPELLFIVAAYADGRHTAAGIARAVGERIGRSVSAANVDVLLGKLRAAGIVGSSDGAVAQAPRVDPLMALRFRAAVVPPGVTRVASAALRPLFLPVVVAAALLTLVALDAWLFFDHGLAQSARAVVMHPALLLVLLALMVLGTVFHELGHATACAYGGARPGAMGVGLYLVWPAFYTDVTDAYRLSRAGRLRTDLGGVYFNALYALAAGAAFLATGAEFLLAVVMIQHVQILQQLIPWGRLDGYYVLTDLTGVPDMLSRVRPVLRSLIPGSGDDPRVRALKPWVRAVASVYVLTLVPMMALTIALLIAGAPRVVATGIRSFSTHLDAAVVAAHHAQWVATALGAVQAVALVTPALGMTLMAFGVARRLTVAAAQRSPALAVTAASTAGAVAAACLVWWPGAGLHPIAPTSRGAIQDGVAVLGERMARPLRVVAARGDTPRRATEAGARVAAAAGAADRTGPQRGLIARAWGANDGGSARAEHSAPSARPGRPGPRSSPTRGRDRSPAQADDRLPAPPSKGSGGATRPPAGATAQPPAPGSAPAAPAAPPGASPTAPAASAPSQTTPVTTTPAPTTGTTTTGGTTTAPAPDPATTPTTDPAGTPTPDPATTPTTDPATTPTTDPAAQPPATTPSPTDPAAPPMPPASGTATTTTGAPAAPAVNADTVPRTPTQSPPAGVGG